jgi:DNA-binding NtrC family response regulator
MAGKIRLLIVDDEERFLENLARRLTLRGFAVTAAANGEEALAAATDQEFDVALVDLKMPGLNGQVVLERLKERHPLTEVIIVTGHGSIDSAVQCTQAGSHSYLQKPCEIDVLLEAVKDAYQKRVARKLELDDDKLQTLLRGATGEGPLGLLRRLRQLEQNATPAPRADGTS